MTERTRQGAGLAFLVDALRRRTDKCIVWPYGVNSKGYGKLKVNGRWTQVHVLVCILAHGERPPGMYACHDCGDHEERRCVNHRHLRWDTPSANQFDRWRFSRLAAGAAHDPVRSEAGLKGTRP